MPNSTNPVKRSAMQTLRRATTAVALTAGLALASVGAAPAASAESNPLKPNKVTCGWATCTAYWSVDRTAELHAEWKDTINSVGSVSAAGVAVGAARLGSNPAGVGAAAVALAIAARSVDFNHMINGAENDNRCLTYKFVPPAVGGGWFGSVSLDNNNCDQGPV